MNAPIRPNDLTPRRDRSDPDREWRIYRNIRRAQARARLVLFWEALWPRLVPLLVVIGLFALVSWAGFWTGIADWVRMAALALFGLAALASLYPLVSLRWPSRAQAFARIEQNSGTPHRPTTGFFDRLAGPESDPETRAIWEAHRARLIADFGDLHTGLPSPGLPRRDPYGLRFLLLLLLAVAFVAAGGRTDRIADAFRGSGSGAAAAVAAARIDAWASPPEYTGRPMILLTGDLARPSGDPIQVPEGTEIVVRAAGEDIDDVTVGIAGTGEPVAEEPRLGRGPREFRFLLDANATVAVAAGGRQLNAWSFTVIPDMPPAIAITEGPVRASGGGLQVAYTLVDDYGVNTAWGEITLAYPIAGARPLVNAPVLDLVVPRTDPNQPGDAITVRDLTKHPWAGLDVDVTLVAADAIGQLGLSEPRSVTLPARTFTNVIAQELVAQRQAMALDARQADNVALALARLADLPEAREDITTYLALRSAYHRLRLADTDNARRDVLDYLWQIAVSLEADPVADAAAELQAAADALREALDHGADPAEIAQLTENLRAAMQQYMQAIAGAQQGQAQPAAAVDTQIMRPDELDDMVDQVQDLAQNGNVELAEQLLNQLEQMMQNMETAANIDDMAREFQPIQQGLDDLGFLMQEQQRLMDETFALQQQQNAPLANPRTEQEAQQLLQELAQRRADQQARADDLARQQRLLRDDLVQLEERMMADGQDLFQLPDAEAAMGAAAAQIGEGRPGLAIPEQAEALEQLQAAAQAIAEQMAERGGAILNNANAGQQDPFGRPPPYQGERYGDNVEVPTVIERQTAREILDVIRQRLEDRGRPQAEIDYLERLIELY